MESWIQSQCIFWYGNETIDWEAMGLAILKTDYGKRVSSPLHRSDITKEAVRSRYGDFGAYRHHIDAQVMKDWILNDNNFKLTSLHRFPITMVDSVNRNDPLIAYNRTVNKTGELSTILWPLQYHLEVAKKGLLDSMKFKDKISKVAFRGALSGTITTNVLTGRTSRADMVIQWKNKSWTNIALSNIPKDIYLTPLQKEKINKLELNHISQEELMTYKYILCIEGADISTSFGWVLASHCVPIHPYPFIYEVWYFNGLTPWVHFIPIKQDGSDLEDVYEWCENNPEICNYIAEQGRKHMLQILDTQNLNLIKTAVIDKWELKSCHIQKC